MTHENNPTSNTTTVNPNESPFKNLLDHPDRFLWALPAVLLIGGLCEWLFSIPSLLAIPLYIVPNIIFALLDERALKQSNRPAPAHWSVFIVPVYIWQRLKLNQQNKVPFIAWCVALVMSSSLGSLNATQQIEDISCEVVTTILFDEYGAGKYGDKAGAMAYSNPELDTPNCIDVSIYKSVTDTFHRAIATLENGKELEVTIKEGKRGDIEVMIPDLTANAIR